MVIEGLFTSANSGEARPIADFAIRDYDSADERAGK